MKQNTNASVKRIVTIGGGTGQYTLLRSLVGIENIAITSVVSMVDSGGSTGVLRDQYGVLPTGDPLKCVLALSPIADAREILLHRFEGQHPSFEGHTAGNLFLTFLARHAGGDFPAAIQALSEILNVKGRVLPVTTDRTTLVAVLSDGTPLFGEAAIDQPRGEISGHIEHAYLVPHHNTLEVYPEVITAIEEADLIIIGPGDLFTSIIPNFLVKGVPEAIQKTEHAKVVYVVNLMTKYGETHGFTISDFVKKIEDSLKRRVDVVIANDKEMTTPLAAMYALQRAFPVVVNENRDEKFFTGPLLTEEGEIARHDTSTLREMIEIVMQD